MSSYQKANIFFFMVADLIDVNGISQIKSTKRRDYFLCCDAKSKCRIIGFGIQQQKRRQKQQSLWIFESESSISVINELPAWLGLAWLRLRRWLHWWLYSTKFNDLYDFAFKVVKNRIFKLPIKTYFHDGFVFVFRRSNNRSFGFCCSECESIYMFRHESLGSWIMDHKITIHEML